MHYVNRDIYLYVGFLSICVNKKKSVICNLAWPKPKCFFVYDKKGIDGRANVFSVLIWWHFSCFKQKYPKNTKQICKNDSVGTWVLKQSTSMCQLCQYRPAEIVCWGLGWVGLNRRHEIWEITNMCPHCADIFPFEIKFPTHSSLFQRLLFCCL